MRTRSEIVRFEDLTWPDVAALPRDVPLVIPLGSGYDLEDLGRSLGNPARLGLLPPIPYGFRGSGLEIPAKAFESYVENLLESLRADGFQQVHLLSPAGLHAMDPTFSMIEQKQEPVSTGFDLLDPSKVLLVPIGHTEQHGHHLPLNTDTVIIEAIAQGTARAVPSEAAALPVMPYGVSTHQRAFAGTLNAGGRAFEDFYLALLDATFARGCNRVYLMSGHGGNCSFLSNVVKYAGERHRRAFIATAWLYLSGPDGIAALEQLRRSTIGGMGHACELETALMLHLRPDLVLMDRVMDETEFITTSSYYMDWIEGGALIANPPWDDDTKTGAYGAGSLATAEHGRLWLEAAIAEKVGHVREINEQHRRREARRRSGFGLWGNG